jgi:hypothetical protein
LIRTRQGYHRSCTILKATSEFHRFLLERSNYPNKRYRSAQSPQTCGDNRTSSCSALPRSQDHRQRARRTACRFPDRRRRGRARYIGTGDMSISRSWRHWIPLYVQTYTSCGTCYQDHGADRTLTDHNGTRSFRGVRYVQPPFSIWGRILC